MNKKLIYVAVAAMGLALTGCGNKVVPVEEKTEVIKVVHALGETEVPKNPKNIAVFDFGILDAMNELEIEVGGLPKADTIPSYLNEYTADTYANLGGLKEPDMEKIYEMQPELIIIGGRQADYYEELSKIAPTVQLSVDNADYMNSFETNMKYLGEMFDKEEIVEEKVSELKEAVQEVKKLAEDKGGNALITLANDGAFSVYGKGSRFGIIHNEFGIPSADETIEVATHGQKASYEYILEKNPNYIFVVDRTAAIGEGKGSAALMFENDLMKTTEAYKNGKIIILDPVSWYISSGGFTSTQTMINEITAALNK